MVLDSCERVGDNQIRQRSAALEGARPYPCHRIRNRHTFQGSATFEGSNFNFSDGVWDCHTHQRSAAMEGVMPNPCHRIWNGHTFQGSATFEGSNFNFSDGVWDCHTCQRSAALEGRMPNRCHRIRNDHAFQGSAIFEGAGTDFSDRVWDCQIHQRSAAWKSKTPNHCHWIRNGNAFQWCAVTEGPIPNPSHRIRNGNTRQRSAAVKGIRVDQSHSLWNVHDSQVFNLTASGFFGTTLDVIDAVQHMHHSISRNATLSQRPRRLQQNHEKGNRNYPITNKHRMNISWLICFQLRLFSLLSNFSPPTIKSTVLIFLVSSSSEGCHPSNCFLNSRMVVSGVTSRTTTFPLICRTGTRKTSMAHQSKDRPWCHFNA